MDDIKCGAEYKIASDRPGFRIRRIGGSDEFPDNGNRIGAFQDKLDDRPGGDEIDQWIVKGFSLVLSVMFFRLFSVDGDHFHCNDLQAFIFKSGYNCAGETSLDPVGLYHDEGFFSWHFFSLFLAFIINDLFQDFGQIEMEVF